MKTQNHVTRLKLNLEEDRNFTAYLLGYIATDGCVYEGRDASYIALSLSAKDRDFLVGLISKLSPMEGSVSSIYEKPKCAQVSTRITCKDLMNLCAAMGITPRKTYTLDPKLDDKSDEFLWYFLRGVIDGDGSVANYGVTQMVRVFTASKKFADCLQKYYPVSSVYVVTPEERNSRGVGFKASTDIHTVTFRGKNLNYLLNNIPLDDFCLQRKTEKLKSLIVSRQDMYRVGENLVYTGPHRDLVREVRSQEQRDMDKAIRKLKRAQKATQEGS